MAKDLTPAQVDALAYDLCFDSTLLPTRDVLALARDLVRSVIAFQSAEMQGKLKALLRDEESVGKIAKQSHRTPEEIREELSAPRDATLPLAMGRDAAMEELETQIREMEERGNPQMHSYRPPQTKQRKRIAGFVAEASAELLIEKHLQKEDLAPPAIRALKTRLMADIKEALLEPTLDEPIEPI